MHDMKNALRDFLHGEASLAAYPGACCRMVDKWIALIDGRSALDRFGRDFVDENSVSAWLSEPGGIAVAVNRVMRSCGYAKTTTPVCGDVGLVITRGRMAMSIFDGSKWIGRDDAGFFAVDKFWKSWRIA